MKKISVIIPVFNETAMIEARLQSLQWLREQGHELIVVDGGSADGSFAKASAWVDHCVHAPKGRAGQLNAGAAVAGGEVFLFLHVDTELGAEAFAVLEETCRECVPVWGRFDITLSGQAWVFRLIARMINLRSALSGIATGDQGVFVSRDAFSTVGGYPLLPLMEDIAISQRLRKITRPLCIRKTIVTSSRRWEKHGVLRTVFLMWALRLAYYLGVPPKRLASFYG